MATMKRLSTGDHMILPDALQKELNMFSLEGYANDHFKRRKQGLIFRRRVPLAELAAWQSGPLIGSLLPMSRAEQAEATKSFQLIQFIMEGSVVEQSEDAISILQQSWTLATLDRARALLDQGVRSVRPDAKGDKAELRDEIYLQLLKQLTRNPSMCVLAVLHWSKLISRRSSSVRGWQLLQVLLLAFPCVSPPIA
jgi:hypothetical protein